MCILVESSSEIKHLPNDAVVMTAFVDFINGPMFDDCQHVRDALFSLVDQSQNDVLNLKEPRELRRKTVFSSISIWWFARITFILFCVDGRT